MDDYIDVLLCQLAEARQDFLPSEYFRIQARAYRAYDALQATFSEKQQELFLNYEAVHNEAADLSEEAYARQVFLLAKAIFR